MARMSTLQSDLSRSSKEHQSSGSASPHQNTSTKENEDGSLSSDNEEVICGKNDPLIATNLKVQTQEQAKKEECIKAIPAVNKIPWQIYLSRILSAWGDRIWDFALGIFMNLINPESLRLAAIQGFLINISVIVFGSAVGNWIDRNQRLFAAKVFLIVQNVSVAIACSVLALHFFMLKEQVRSIAYYVSYSVNRVKSQIL